MIWRSTLVICQRSHHIRLCVLVFQCLQGIVPSYLSTVWRLTSDLEGHNHLISAGCGQLQVPHYSRSTFGCRAFTYAGPTAWSTLSDYLRRCNISLSTFKTQLKHFCLPATNTMSALEILLQGYKMTVLHKFSFNYYYYNYIDKLHFVCQQTAEKVKDES